MLYPYFVLCCILASSRKNCTLGEIKIGKTALSQYPFPLGRWMGYQNLTVGVTYIFNCFIGENIEKREHFAFELLYTLVQLFVL